jgi:Nucleotidyltransferase domain
MVILLPAVMEFRRQLEALGWVSDLLVAGSLATGDYIPGVSDLDLVAFVDGPVDRCRELAIVDLHRRLEMGAAAHMDLGCVYVDAAQAVDVHTRHPTWTHGLLVQRILSGITRAELVRHGYAVFGRSPPDVLPAMTDDDVREAARAELAGYWAWAARRPWMWLNPVIVDLGLTSMARGRYSLRTGELLTKSQAVEQAHAPAWLIDQMRARRHGGHVPSPRLPAALIAWRDARRTTSRIGAAGR